MKEMTIENTMIQSPTTGITLPHIVPYMSLFSHINHKPSFNALYQNTIESKGIHSSIETEDQLDKNSYFKNDDLEKFRLSTKKMMSNVVFDDTLLDLFRTEYHIRLHWGSQSRFILRYPENADEGHEEFEKVITTLFEMSSMVRNKHDI